MNANTTEAIAVAIAAGNASVFFRDGNDFTIGNREDLQMSDTLPVGTYRLDAHPMRGLFLTKIEDFTTPARLYGHTRQQAERILNTFRDRPYTTGALLSGTAGSGKTMLSTLISQMALKEDVITIVINQRLAGEEVNAFLSSIKQPSIIIFDEFEKVFDAETQNKLLTLLDGTFKSKKLFILTVNDTTKVNRYMTNRPGRLFYALEFKGLDKDFIKEYCDDKLTNKDNTLGVIVASQFFWEFSFDMLQALVEEMNRYGENATEAMKMLNMRPLNSSSGSYEVQLYHKGKRINVRNTCDTTISGTPMVKAQEEYTLELYPPVYRTEDGNHDTSGKQVKENDLKEYMAFELTNDRMVKYDMDADVFIYDTEHEGYQVHFKRVAQRSTYYNYDVF
jgi:hypothetical protein